MLYLLTHCCICFMVVTFTWSIWYSQAIRLLEQKLIGNWLRDVFQVHISSFCNGILGSLDVELKGSKDFSKLYAGIAILGYIASLPEPVNSRAFSYLLTFLSHRYPKVWIPYFYGRAHGRAQLKYITFLSFIKLE